MITVHREHSERSSNITERFEELVSEISADFTEADATILLQSQVTELCTAKITLQAWQNRERRSAIILTFRSFHTLFANGLSFVFGT